MNQNLNNQNNNDFNMQGNNEISNNQNANNIVQPLNNNVYQNQNFQQVPNNNQNFNPKKNNKMILIVVGVVILLIVAVAIYFMFFKKEQSNRNNNQNSNSNINVNDGKDDDANDKNLENTKVVSVPGHNIYVNCSMDLRTKEQGRTVLMYSSKDKLVGLTFNKSEEYKGNLDGVVEFLSEKFLQNISNYQDGNYESSRILIESSSKTKINGFDSLKFEGKALNKSNDGEWNSYVYGYSFIINDIPVAVIGIVSDKSQETNMINEIKQNVDAIASTIRTEK